jgi:hypothetical protein
MAACTTGICSGTQTIEQAGAALAWLDSLPSRPKDANIFGKVSQRTIKASEPRRESQFLSPIHPAASAQLLLMPAAHTPSPVWSPATTLSLSPLPKE